MKEQNVTFMSKYSILVYSCILAVVVAGLGAYLIQKQKKSFDATVRTSLQVSEGYDQQFIDMVNRLEDELAERASFGYAGRKDPMTGTTRMVAARPTITRSARRAAAAAPAQAAAVESNEVKVVEEVDPVRLTAIIFDNSKNIYTAVVMDGDRSFSVEVGDRVAGRRITRITNENVHMENDQYRFTYGILGNNTRVEK